MYSELFVDENKDQICCTSDGGSSNFLLDEWSSTTGDFSKVDFFHGATRDTVMLQMEVETVEIEYVSDEEEQPAVSPDGPWLVPIHHHGTGGAHYGGKAKIY